MARNKGTTLKIKNAVFKPEMARANSQSEKTTIDAKTAVPIILAWLGITAKPEAPDAYKSVVDGLTEYLTTSGHIKDGKLQSLWIPSSTGTPGAVQQGIQYLPEMVMNDAVKWFYKKDNPLLKKNDQDVPADCQDIYLQYQAKWPYFGTCTRGGHVCILWDSKPIKIDNKNHPSCRQCYDTVTKSIFTFGPWDRVDSNSWFLHSRADYKPAISTVDVRTEKLPLPDQTAKDVIVDPEVTKIVTEQDETWATFNPTWNLVSGNQAEAQMPVEVPSPTPHPVAGPYTPLYPKTTIYQTLGWNIGEVYGPYDLILPKADWTSSAEDVKLFLQLNGLSSDDILYCTPVFKGTQQEMLKQKRAYNGLKRIGGIQSYDNRVAFTAPKEKAPDVDIHVQVWWTR